MPNYNTQLQSNNTDLQNIIHALQPSGGEQATPVISVDNSNGLITATAGAKSTTYQLAFQPAKTITPSATSQVAVSSGYYTGGDIIVGAIPSTYVKPSYTKAAATYTPTTTNQTISAGTYLTGTQTIKGDANLVAGNIKSGVSIFGVNGTLQEGSSGGGESTDALGSIIARTVTTYTNDRVTTIGSYAFYSCTSLTSVNFPVAATIGSYAFYYCTNLTSVSFPKVTTIGSNAFAYCTSLTSVSFPAAKIISDHAFYSCKRLTSIYLTASTICSLSASNAFSYTGIWSNKGSIYVPSSLVASYKAATNWAFFSNRIFSTP